MKRKFTALLLTTLMLSQGIYADCIDSENDCCDVPSCGWGSFEVGGEWLYWKADQDGMNYASHNTAVVEQDGVLDSKRSPIRPKFTEKSGYRLFASYETVDTNWKVSAIFTHAPSSASSSSSSPFPVTADDYIQVLPVNFALLNSLVISSFSDVHTQWDLDLNYFDLDLQWNFSICQNLEIAPHIGFRGLWIDQKFHWNGIDSTGSTSRGVAKLKVDGYGVEGGLFGRWNVGYGVSIIGNVGGSLLYSKVNSHGVLHYSISDFQANDGYKDTVHRATPTFDTFIGVQYNKLLCNYDIGVRLGWENHVFFDVNQFSLNKTQNLTMQGLTLGGSVGF